MNVVALLREQFQKAHEVLEATMSDVTPEQAHWMPPGKANPLGASYVHVVISEDAFLAGMATGRAPLYTNSWAGKVGISEPRPAPGETSWDQWARRVRVDLPALRQYAQAVYASTDEYLSSLTDDDLEQTVDRSVIGMGHVPLRALLYIYVGHVHDHGGEISCLKGLQGVQGYPF